MPLLPLRNSLDKIQDVDAGTAAGARIHIMHHDDNKVGMAMSATVFYCLFSKLRPLPLRYIENKILY